MKVVVTGRNFTGMNDSGLRMLQSAGFEVEDYSNFGFGIGSDEEEVYEKIKDADAVIAGLEPLRRNILERCRKLKLISRRGIGYDSIDVDACKELGITLCRTFGAVEGAVSEQVMAYILYFARRVDLQNDSMKKGEWKRVMMPGAKNSTLGLIGFGGIGKQVAKRAVPFGMKVLYYCRHPEKEWEEEYKVTYADYDRLLRESDYIVVCVPLTESTRNLIAGEEFAKMKETAVLINIARSPIVDIYAWKEALDGGKIRGGALDCFPAEPCTDSIFLDSPNMILTPHTAPYTYENFNYMNTYAAQNVIDYFNGCLKRECIVV